MPKKYWLIGALALGPLALWGTSMADDSVSRAEYDQLRLDLCTTKQRLYEQGLLGPPSRSEVCQDIPREMHYTGTGAPWGMR